MNITPSYKSAPKWIGICLSMLIFVFPVASQGTPSDSLMQYLEIAARNNPGVMEKFSEYQAAIQKLPQVGSLPDPELSLGVFLKPMELLGGKQVADIRLMQMFPWFGVLKNAKDEMSLMAKARYEAFLDAKLQVNFDVQRTWYELYKVQQNIQISNRNIEILRTIERLTLVKFQAGSATGTSGAPGMQSNPMAASSGSSGLADVYRVQMEIGELENNIALLNNQKTTITARFNSYLDRPASLTVTIADSLQPTVPELSLTTESDSMLADNPMLVMLRYEQQSLEARKQMVTHMGYPMVGLGINYSLIQKSGMSASSMNGKDMLMPMATITLPIYRQKYRAMLTEADLLKTAKGQGYQATYNALRSEYYQALQLFQDAQRRTTLYKDQKNLAQRSLDIMIKSFSASGAVLTDILRIRQQLLDYEMKQVEAVVDYNTSVAWLKKLRGGGE